MTYANSDVWALKTVSSTMHKLEHDAITVLKMDVEGAEWYAVEDMVKSKLIANHKISQFCVELHFDPAKYVTVLQL